MIVLLYYLVTFIDYYFFRRFSRTLTNALNSFTVLTIKYLFFLSLNVDNSKIKFVNSKIVVDNFKIKVEYLNRIKKKGLT